ncbi:caspase domain-containing protein [Mycena polygramma]|nr:caspase domain-containing protein [Mycena polygramma]
MEKGQKPNFFALLIGIDKYKHRDINNLSGCVADADDMFDYLTDNLSVPVNNINILRNETATRYAIITSLYGLASDNRIGRGDAIIIFFAGHGAEAKAPEGWPTGGQPKIQMLLPYNFDPHANNDEQAQGLFDRTFNTLLSKIAKQKGNNITVILDSCFAGSSTRTHLFEFGARGIELPENYRILPSTDKDILFAQRKQVVATGFEDWGAASHVLLAATLAGAPAGEANKRGVFTAKLLDFLRNEETAHLTYLDVIQSLEDLTGQQHPQCVGKHYARLLFDVKTPSNRPQLHCVTTDPKSKGSFILGAGKANGISVGARFDILETRDLNATCLGSLVAGTPDDFTTPLRPDPDVTDPMVTVKSVAWARQTHVGKHVGLRVAFPVDNAFLPILVRLVNRTKEQQRSNLRDIQAVDMDQYHELAVSKDAFGMCTFDIGDPACTALGLRRVPHTVALDHEDVCPILFAAAEFFHNLRRSSDSNQSHEFNGPETLNVKLEAWCLEGEKTTGGDLNKNGMMEVCVKKEDAREYGFNIVNNGSKSLYVWVFVFDMVDLSRTDLFVAHEVADYSLPGYGSLRLGYGAPNVAPRKFTPADGLGVEVMHLKVFFTSEIIDLSHVAQRSPFLQQRTMIASVGNLKEVPVWGTQLLTIKQTNDP